jgi:plasmid stabilization system protein ParE
LILKLHRRPEEEIREAATWYSERAEGLDRRFLHSVREALETLEADPQRFARLETMPDEAPFRRVLLEGFPYVIVYEVFENEVFVYTVAHASRRPNYWRRRKHGPS